MSSHHIDNHRAESHCVCWGEVLWDLFPDGRMLGGAPANVAYHLAALGERVALASRVGDDALGHEARAALARHGVDTATVQLDEQRPTGRVEVTLRDGEPSYRLVPDCAWEHIAVTPAVEDALSRASAFCFGTLSQRHEISSFRRALTLLPDSCLRICDVNLRPHHVDFEVLCVALEVAQVVKMNQQEAAIIAERAGIDDLTGWLFQHMGVELVALTRGAHGSALLRGTEIADHPGIPAADGGDNVGAGDAFTAVLCQSLVRQRPLVEIAERANRYASFIASQRGATPTIPAAVVAELSELAGSIGR